jgi:NTP pyrophosphatase (non-canonical NTP hydrolase)
MYMLFGLAEEVGELHGKFAKNIRNGMIDDSDNFDFGWGTDRDVKDIETSLELVKSEAGDVLWMLAGFCAKMGWSLEDIARKNIDKLKDRQERGVIVGEGDNR